MRAVKQKNPNHKAAKGSSATASSAQPPPSSPLSTEPANSSSDAPKPETAPLGYIDSPSEPETKQEAAETLSKNQQEATAKDKKKLVSETRKLMHQDAPRGWQELKVSGDGLLCGFRAVVRSTFFQYRELPVPRLEDFKAIVKHDPEYKDRCPEKGLTNDNEFYVEQLAIVLRIWSSIKSFPLQLGIVQDEHEPILTGWADGLEPPSGRLWIWVSVDQEQAAKRGIHRVDHYQGLRPIPEAPGSPLSSETDDVFKQMFAPYNSTSQEPEGNLYPLPESYVDAATTEFDTRLHASFGELLFEEETVPRAARIEHTKSFDAHLIDRNSGTIMNRYSDRNGVLTLKTRVDLRVDHFRPYLKVAVTTDGELEKYETADQGDIHCEHEDNKPDKAILQQVMASYTYQSLLSHGERDVTRGIRAVDLGQLDTEPQEIQKAARSALHPSTWTLINGLVAQGRRVILIDIYHDGDFPEIGVFFNTPYWGSRAANALKDNGFTRVILEGFQPTLTAVKTFAEFIERNPSPLARFFTGTRRRWAFTRYTLTAIPNIQNTGFQRIIAFYNMAEYATTMYLTHQKEFDVLRQAIHEFETQIHIVHLIESRTTTEEAVYFAFIDLSMYTVRCEKDKSSKLRGIFRPREGDLFKMSFNAEDDFDEVDKRYWTFKVTKRLTFAPEHSICGVVTRPWYREIKVFSADDPNIMKLNPSLGMTETRIHAAGDAGNQCHLKYQRISKTDENIAFNLNLLVNEPKDAPYTPFNKRIFQILLGRRIDQAEIHDFFKAPRKSLDLKNIQSVMQLGSKQQDAVTNMETAPIPILQGSPGTGKTWLIKETCVPFLIMPDKGIHAIMSPSNAGADGIAVSVHGKIEALRQDPNIISKYSHITNEHDCYVLRIHSRASEQAVRNLTVTANLDRPDNARPQTFPEAEEREELKELSEAEKLVHEALKDAFTTIFPGLNDARVKQYHFSLGARMLQSMGRWANATGDGYCEPWPGYLGKHGRFRSYLDDRARGVNLSEGELKEFQNGAYNLSVDIMQNARVIVGTTAGISAKAILDIIKDHCVAITCDENTREAEASLIPIFTTRFSRNPGLSLVGDHMQLPPIAAVNQKTAVTAKQKELSLMKRLIIAGHPYVTLDKQYRMHPDILTPANRIFYENKLTSAPGLHARVGSSPFRQLSHQILGNKYHNAFVLDIVPGSGKDSKRKSKYRVVTGPTLSKSCIFQAIVGTDLATKFIDVLRKVKPEGRVGILTQYTDQKNLYLKAKQNMQDAEYEGYSNLWVGTIDGAQGLEFDYVVLDLVIDDKIGMMDLRQRVNVGITRAKLGLCILGPMSFVGTARGNTEALRSVKNHFKGNLTKKVKDVEHWPKCRFLGP